MKEKTGFIKIFLIFLIILCVLAGVIYAYKSGMINGINNKNEDSVTKVESKANAEDIKVNAKNEYALTDNYFSKFDFSFLKFENKRENKIYSPLSIKYAFKMLEEATTGNAKEQLSSIVNGYELTTYHTNKNMAFANAFFIRDSLKNDVKEEYVNLLKNSYNAEIKYDSFSNANNINNWVDENTLGLINKLFEDEDVEPLEFVLLNALGIDMEWKNKFFSWNEEDNITSVTDYQHENFYWDNMDELYKLKFDEDNEVSSMKVVASLNNYDIVKELGEENIKQIVKDAFVKFAKEEGKTSYVYEEWFNSDLSDESIEKAFEKYWNGGTNSNGYEEKGYLKEISENYGKVDCSTDFSIYVDDNVKVFAKDLKESNGTTLQYIGIMPKEEDLDEFINNTSETEIKNLISELKELKLENFKDGVLTKIIGYIPKFTFEYELNLQEDLEKLGVTDIFEKGKANLTNMLDNEDMFIGKVAHKANIEFTQDGIKAAAATGAGGLGGGGDFDYIFDIPVEEIDITFDKPYMFIIRDKDTGETWFVGTVYEPLNAEEETGYISNIY